MKYMGETVEVIVKVKLEGGQQVLNLTHSCRCCVTPHHEVTDTGHARTPEERIIISF